MEARRRRAGLEEGHQPFAHPQWEILPGCQQPFAGTALVSCPPGTGRSPRASPVWWKITHPPWGCYCSAWSCCSCPATTSSPG